MRGIEGVFNVLSKVMVLREHLQGCSSIGLRAWDGTRESNQLKDLDAIHCPNLFSVAENIMPQTGYIIKERGLFRPKVRRLNLVMVSQLAEFQTRVGHLGDRQGFMSVCRPLLFL